MSANSGYEYYRDSSLIRTLRVVTIRQIARKLVGECSDYQIMFCAAAAQQIDKMALSLEDLSESDLGQLYAWMQDQKHIDIYAS